MSSVPSPALPSSMHVGQEKGQWKAKFQVALGKELETYPKPSGE